MRTTTGLVLGIYLLAIHPAGAATLLLQGTGNAFMYGVDENLLNYDVNGDGIEEIIVKEDLSETVREYRALDISGATLWSFSLDTEAQFGEPAPNYFVDFLGFIPFRSSTSRDAFFAYRNFDNDSAATLLLSTEDNAIIFEYPLGWKYIGDFTGDGAAELLLWTDFYYPETNSFYVFTGVSASSATDLVLPGKKLRVGANRPNPFNPSTTIEFTAPVAGTAHVSICALDGHEVYRTTVQVEAPGPRSFAWAGRDLSGRALPSGVYLARVSLGGHQDARKITLLK